MLAEDPGSSPGWDGGAFFSTFANAWLPIFFENHVVFNSKRKHWKKRWTEVSSGGAKPLAGVSTSKLSIPDLNADGRTATELADKVKVLVDFFAKKCTEDREHATLPSAPYPLSKDYPHFDFPPISTHPSTHPGASTTPSDPHIHF